MHTHVRTWAGVLGLRGLRGCGVELQRFTPPLTRAFKVGEHGGRGCGVEWYRLAAVGGHAGAMTNLAGALLADPQVPSVPPPSIRVPP